jgi:hypothetical protein
MDGHYPHSAFSLSGLQGDLFSAESIRRFGRQKLRRNRFRSAYLVHGTTWRIPHLGHNLVTARSLAPKALESLSAEMKRLDAPS